MSVAYDFFVFFLTILDRPLIGRWWTTRWFCATDMVYFVFDEYIFIGSVLIENGKRTKSPPTRTKNKYTQQ